MTKSGNGWRVSPSAWTLLKEAVSGKEQDYTSGSTRKAVILLAIPMMLEMSMESVFAVVDIFFVSHLGKHATSTVGLTESVITIVYSLAMGISMAASAMVARRIGEKNKPEAARAAGQSIILSIATTVVISALGVVFAADILRMMGAERAAITEGTTYTRIIMGGSMVIMLLFLINGIFRGAGNPMIAMKSLWLANICNIILCPLLIRGWGPVPAFGLTGAALATTIGRGVGVVYQLYHLFNGKGVIQISLHHFKPVWSILKSLANIAWPGSLQFLIGSGSWIVLAGIVAHTGHSEASAGYQIALRVVMFFILPAWGMSNAAATLVGQNLGAGLPGRAQEAVVKTVKYNALFMGIVSCIFLLFAEWVASFFTAEPDVKAYAVLAMRIISAGYIFYGIGMVISNAFNGAGDTRTPTWVNLFGFWFFQIPIAWLMANTFSWGPAGVFTAIPVAETAITIVSFLIFRKGKWKLVKI
ncbi:MATE family efflux transporter [Agriterribacter sp.]|uniref:MATE family efflux transporter n=1 Tax=Agriterribacter sp. TaxID=2821509 RepID=UPI002BEB64F4|nr:MATE family efflux transporter [Agriterribacter sp.]HTN05394.1 MATE family efflux transporter [Agriterribacter sp.]